jgi:hypothetical protein
VKAEGRVLQQPRGRQVAVKNAAGLSWSGLALKLPVSQLGRDKSE